MQRLNLDSLLGNEYAHATFHDAEMESIHIDFNTNSIKLRFMIPCGFLTENELSYQRGTLEFQGIAFYSIEPSNYDPSANDKPALWITSDGSLPDERVKASAELPSDLPQGAFAHYFYSSTTNNFIVVAAMHASFNWDLPCGSSSNISFQRDALQAARP
jgi:hypothetical protein